VIGFAVQSLLISSEIDWAVNSTTTSPVTTGARPGLESLRNAPPGLPDPDVQPPVLAESADPFSELRIVHLVARIERGNPIRIADLVDRLNATYVDWLFAETVVADAIVRLQSNWMADYRNAGGIVLEDGDYGLTIAIEDSSRVDPWIVGQALRLSAACQDRLNEFSRRDRGSGVG
jgi:hypothetical protein